MYLDASLSALARSIQNKCSVNRTTLYSTHPVMTFDQDLEHMKFLLDLFLVVEFAFYRHSMEEMNVFKINDDNDEAFQLNRKNICVKMCFEIEYYMITME